MEAPSFSYLEIYLQESSEFQVGNKSAIENFYQFAFRVV